MSNLYVVCIFLLLESKILKRWLVGKFVDFGGVIFRVVGYKMMYIFSFRIRVLFFRFFILGFFGGFCVIELIVLLECKFLYCFLELRR